MGDNDKPFVCMHPGCIMRFTNEDHLSVHRLKHEMSLTFTSGSKPGSFLTFADQTPTPTKFLKNCEEIGLFNELTKNPFEEAFKKASELIDVKSPLHLPMITLDPDALHTPTPHTSIQVQAINTPDVTLPTQSLSRVPEFVPLPGPDSDMGSTIGTTPGGSTVCGTPRSGNILTPRKSTGTPAGTPTSSSTMGLPFKLKLKREPLGENELSMLPGGVVSPSVPRMSLISTAETDIALVEKSVSATIPVVPPLLPKPMYTIPNQFTSPAKIAMVTPTQMASNNIVTSIPIDAKLPVNTMGGAITGSPLLVNSATSNAKNPQYFLQVMIQMPNGEMMPVQIPASLSTAATTSPVTTPAITTLAKSTAPVAMVTSTPTLSAFMATTVQESGSGAASSLTKQKLKAALQQSVLSSNMRVMSEAVDQLEHIPSDITATTLSSTTPISIIHTTPAIRPQTLTKFSCSQQLSPASSITTPVSPDLDYDMDYEDEDDDPDMPSLKRRKGDEDSDDRRKKFLERNRAAAARCRMKKKNWITNLEKKAEDLQNTNSKLQQEVTLLRSEVAQLKTLLLAHKECPITLQLQNAVTPVETQYNSISSTCQTPILIDRVAPGDATSSNNCIPVAMATHSRIHQMASPAAVQPVAPCIIMQSSSTVQPTTTQSISITPIAIEIEEESYGKK